MEKKLEVSAIKNGTVIDHIPSESLFKVISILNIENLETQVTIGSNLTSKKYETKGIIKISEKFPDKNDLNKISLIAPSAKINIIKDYKVVEKYIVEVPDSINYVAKCINPKCITNIEEVDTKFRVLNNNGSISLRCHYCEKITDQEHISIVK